MTETALVQPKLSDWFRVLTEDCQKILDNLKDVLGIQLFRGKHALGKRVLREKLRLDAKSQQELADSLGISQHSISDAMRFAEAYPDIDIFLSPFSNAVAKLPSWRRTIHSLLPQKRRIYQPMLESRVLLRLAGLQKGDFRDVTEREIPDNSLDLILTDPPYGADAFPLWDALGEQAARTLKQGGWLVTMSGQAYLPHVLELLASHLTYHWTIALKMGPDSASIFGRHIHNWWKPILVFAKSPAEKIWIRDFIQGAGPEKGNHKWQQATDDFRVLVEQFTGPGDNVWDPMAGTGTVIEACQIAEGGPRHVIAHEIDPKFRT